MHPTLHNAVLSLLNRAPLTSEVMRECVGVMMEGAAGEIDIAALLTAMAAKGPTAGELVGAAQAMRARVTPIATRRSALIDTCGTGGDRLHTFNISTASAIVLAGCGVNVAKHGNRSVSSSSGSADVLEALGVNVGLTAEAAGQCLDETGIAFCFAPLFHGAMKHVAPVRRSLGFPTIFNLLGPLTNPASAGCQVIGTSSNERAELIAAAIAQLGTERTYVVCGNNELDEVSLWGTTVALEVTSAGIRRHEWHASDFQLPECRVVELQVESAGQSADVIRSVFSGQQSAAADMVVANAATGLLSAGRSESLPQAAQMARVCLNSGKAQEVLSLLIQKTQELAG
ncbi:MAG: anthranilate phosphoribosyltransferase [Planctomycetaceae bacterium]|nr:anthranilate phosphoribosyltransferase [Planctomycetaceae bacterium]